MAKMVEVTEAGDATADIEDKKIMVNANEINFIEGVPEDEEGSSKIVFKSGDKKYVVESQSELATIING